MNKMNMDLIKSEIWSQVHKEGMLASMLYLDKSKFTVNKHNEQVTKVEHLAFFIFYLMNVNEGHLVAKIEAKRARMQTLMDKDAK